MIAFAWEVRRSGQDRYSVRHRSESGVWETPSQGGWNGSDGALFALYASGATETTGKEMLRLAEETGKTVRLEDGQITIVG